MLCMVCFYVKKIICSCYKYWNPFIFTIYVLHKWLLIIIIAILLHSAVILSYRVIMIIEKKRKKNDITIIKYNSSILFSIIIFATAVISFFLVLLIPSSSLSSFSIFTKLATTTSNRWGDTITISTKLNQYISVYNIKSW